MDGVAGEAAGAEVRGIQAGAVRPVEGEEAADGGLGEVGDVEGDVGDDAGLDVGDAGDFGDVGGEGVGAPLEAGEDVGEAVPVVRTPPESGLGETLRGVGGRRIGESGWTLIANGHFDATMSQTSRKESPHAPSDLQQ